MTKEEAKKILSGYVKACNEDDFLALEMFEYEEVIEAMTMGANALSEPSLPSDLDEAARSIRDELYLKEGKRDPYGNPYFLPDALMQAVFAGAEWMAGQGVTKEAVIGMATEEISINVSQKTLNELDLCPGDKVVVQIRKK